jgi:hypothetical protein
MNVKSLANQLSLLSAIIHRSKDCPEIPQLSDEWEASSEMIMQAAAVLEKIPLVLDTNVSTTGIVADCHQ